MITSAHLVSGLPRGLLREGSISAFVSICLLSFSLYDQPIDVLPWRRISLDRKDETFISLNCEPDVECISFTSEDVVPALCGLLEEPST
ncbi:unnamed protein product [Strongylus vulgaris]|uniref:Uncharacterized protein n=1 Tax=Strongylus vulgaris TaxID=40348 RepID=A0A3P7HX65_STRVU|nr:unnamed protein product [Strongylus vulgaris]